MKAILIIDLNDDTDLTSEADVIIENGDFRLETKTFLKPLPKPKDEHTKMDNFNWELESIINAEHRGYNNCLEEIIGEEKE